ncbi:hypothetical protein SDC9_153696 [bioreactor metagenome]|uniref:Uncharacterized protein n=1 Tax=bioreactor metagenome TaxID=1076179 RepID=A0A645EY92_9ZZZZ
MKRFGTAYGIAKFYEILGWIVMIGGILVPIVLLASDNLEAMVAIGIIVSAIVLGLMIIYNAQLVLVVVSTEANTFAQLQEAQKTNAMLQETLGKMTVSLQKMANQENQ